MRTPTKWKTVGLVALAEFLAMSLWFSASAVTPALIADWQIDTNQAAWITMAVQIGFVVGALLSALFNAADLIAPRKLFAAGTLLGALTNLLIAVFANGIGPTIVLRFFTGVALAAVYPVGMKIMATWMKEDRGLGLGLLVGALTLGSASPHLLRALGNIDAWRPVLIGSALLALVAGIIVFRYGKLGPFRGKTPPFNWRFIGSALRDRGLRLANFGYFGHMWELYAMWTWIGLFLLESEQAARGTALTAAQEARVALLTFGVIGVGSVGSLLAGRLSDQWGRTRTTTLSMMVSGTCALSIGLLFGQNLILVGVVALVWGFAIVADSAQFSTAVSELAEPAYLGSALTMQTSLGFLLTLISIRLVPLMVDAVGWRWAFAFLALGPLCGCVAMRQLRRSPMRAKLAGGNG